MHDIQKVPVVYVLRDCYEGTIVGVYTEAGMQAYKDEHIKEALAKYNEDLNERKNKVRELEVQRLALIQAAEDKLPSQKRFLELGERQSAHAVKKERKKLLRDADYVQTLLLFARAREKRLVEMNTEDIFNTYYCTSLTFESHFLLDVK